MHKQQAPVPPVTKSAQPSRRGFLKGAAITAATTAIADTALESLAIAQETQPVVGPGAVKVKLRLNGADKTLEVEPRTTLAEALRYHADLTGTKVVCDRGACSACTVWIDGTPELSCMTLAL